MAFSVLLATVFLNTAFLVAEEPAPVFEAKGFTILEQQVAPGDGKQEDLIRLKWDHIPLASEMSDVDFGSLPDDATFSAACNITKKGTIQNCRLAEQSPDGKKLEQVFSRAVSLLRVTPDIAQKVHKADLVIIGLRITNPEGVNDNFRPCLAPFCSVIPPPPPPPPMAPTKEKR